MSTLALTTSMQHKTRLRIVFWGSLLIGVGLCVGGLWVPPLLVPGGILLAASFGMYQSAFSEPDHIADAGNMVANHIEDPRTMVTITTHAPVHMRRDSHDVNMLNQFYLSRPQEIVRLERPALSDAENHTRLTLA